MKVVSVIKTGQTRKEIYSKAKNSGKEITEQELSGMRTKLRNQGPFVLLSPEMARTGSCRG